MEGLITKMKSLPEIELLEFMEALSEHLRKEKLEGLIDQVFDVGRGIITELEDQIEKLEDEVQSESDENFDLRSNVKKKVVDTYPNDMLIEMLATQLNIPALQQSVNDINENYLTRPASKKWILCDFPEKVIKASTEAGKPAKVLIPPALRSLLPEKTCQLIRLEWQRRFAQQKIIV